MKSIKTTIALLFLSTVASQARWVRVQPDLKVWNAKMECFCIYLAPQKNRPMNMVRAVTICQEPDIPCPKDPPGPLRWVNGVIECPIPNGWETQFEIWEDLP